VSNLSTTQSAQSYPLLFSNKPLVKRWKIQVIGYLFESSLDRIDWSGQESFRYFQTAPSKNNL
jgi:serine kinase of HPr protein (carbohydrate metabolism regulator)